MRKSLIFVIVCVLWIPVATLADGAHNVIVGVDTLGAANMNDAQQDALIEQLQKNGVKTVGTGIGGRFNRFIINAYQHGIGAVVAVWPVAKPTAQPRPADPSLGLQWAQQRLSDADPEAFRASVTALLAPIEAAGVPLTAFEFGNEINGPFYNGDFLPAQATGRMLGLSDLDNPNDPEGQAIAASYRGYLSLLAVLKDVRDHSKVNRKTPIISAGMADAGLPGRTGQKLDGVSIPATFAFLRRNGMDKLVDGYGVHVYPTGDLHYSALSRTADLEQDAFALCTADKPCWLTEWGFKNTDQSCPLKDGTRAQVTQLEREAFEPFVEQGRLAGILYYMWGGLPWQKTGNVDPNGIFRCGALTEAGKLALSPLSSAASQGASAHASDALNSQSSNTACMDCISIRVGLPKVVQGPGPGIPDGTFTVVRLPNGRFRGFSPTSTTYAIDGDSPSDMAGKPVPVLGPAPSGQYGESGEWIGHIERSGNRLLAWVHDETGDRWDTTITSLQSVSMAVSDNNGMSWQRLGQIITGTEGWVQGKVTGVGGADAIDGKDGYYYLYSWWNRNPGGGVIVSRAPVTNPGPGNWKKYFNGSWSEPGLGGNATILDAPGGNVARWIATGETVKFGSNPGGVGGGLYVSQDHVHFKPLGVTVMPGDGGTWKRPDPHDVAPYQNLLDANTGENQLGDHWMLAYTYIQPNEGFGQRYLVLRPVEVSRSRKADEPAGGILLARWYNPALHDRWSTTAPVPSVRGTEYKVEAKLGYLLTALDAKRPTFELEECLSKPGQPVVHVLMQKRPEGWVCESQGYTRSRTVGFVFTFAQPGTQPLYSCYSEAEKSYFAANTPDCDHLGKQEALLGYDLKE